MVEGGRAANNAYHSNSDTPVRRLHPNAGEMMTPMRQKAFTESAGSMTPGSARRQLRDITNSSKEDVLTGRRSSLVTVPSKLRNQVSIAYHLTLFNLNRDLEVLPVEYASLPPTIYETPEGFSLLLTNDNRLVLL